MLAKTIAAAARGDNAAEEFPRFAEGFLPGNSLWYSRLAFERLVKDQLTELADPAVRQKFRRAERKARKEYGTGYWWRKGEAAPRRAPEIGQK